MKHYAEMRPEEIPDFIRLSNKKPRQSEGNTKWDINPWLENRLYDLWAEGWPVNDIAHKLGITPQTIMIKLKKEDMVK